MQRGGCGGVAGPLLAGIPLPLGGVDVNYRCVCGKAFSRRAPYKRHLDVAHSIATSHKCRVCGKTFGSCNTLTMHMSVHRTDAHMSAGTRAAMPPPPPRASSVMKTVAVPLVATLSTVVNNTNGSPSKAPPQPVATPTVKTEALPTGNTNVMTVITEEECSPVKADVKVEPSLDVRKSVRLQGKVPVWKQQEDDDSKAELGIIAVDVDAVKAKTDTNGPVGVRKRKNGHDADSLVSWDTKPIDDVGAEIEVTQTAATTLPLLKKQKGTKRMDNFVCPVCGKQFLSDKYLSMHRALHEVVQPAENLMSEEYRQSESSIAINSSLAMASMTSAPATATTAALKQMTAAGSGPIHGTAANGTSWTCRICHKTFAQNSNFKNHMRTHSDERPYVCAVCCIGFKERYHLKKHELFKHSSELREACSVCGKRFKDSTAVRAHERIHSDLRPYSCRRCGKAFKTSECLWHHENRSKACGASVDAKAITDTKTAANKKAEFKGVAMIAITCAPARPQQNTLLPKPQNRQTLEAPQLSAQIVEPETSKVTVPNECRVIQQEAPTIAPITMDISEQIMQQVAVELEQQRAWQQDNVATNVVVLTTAPRQLAPHPLKTPRYTRNRCSKHMTEHSEERPHRCDSCDIGFKLKVHLKKHNLYRHSDDYPCECSICGKGFKDSSAVRLHERTHSSERPFACTCGKTFKTRENLWGHQHRLQCDPMVPSCGEDDEAIASFAEMAHVVTSELQGQSVNGVDSVACREPAIAPRPAVPMQLQAMVGNAGLPALAIKQVSILPPFETFAPSVAPSAVEGGSYSPSPGCLPPSPQQPSFIARMCPTIQKFLLTKPDHPPCNVRLPGIQQIFQPPSRPPPPYSERPSGNVLVLPNPAGAMLPEQCFSGTREVYTSIRRQLAAKNGDSGEEEDEDYEGELFASAATFAGSPLGDKPPCVEALSNGFPVIYWDDAAERKPGYWQKDTDSMFHDISNNGFSQL